MAEQIYRIGVISDTHGLIRDEVRDILRTCQVILHGGDINRQEILEELKAIAPLFVVRGNNDKEWAEGLPETFSGAVCGLNVFMVHNRKHLPEDLGDADLVIFGHSHRYEEKRENGRVLLNPGSCGPRRFGQPITMAVVEVGVDLAGGAVRAETGDMTGGAACHGAGNAVCPGPGGAVCPGPGSAAVHGRILRVNKVDIPHESGGKAGKNI